MVKKRWLRTEVHERAPQKRGGNQQCNENGLTHGRDLPVFEAAPRNGQNCTLRAKYQNRSRILVL